jgi:hypothetical protein
MLPDKEFALTGTEAVGGVGTMGLGPRSFALSGVQALGEVGTPVAVYWTVIDDSQTPNWQNINNS